MSLISELNKHDENPGKHWGRYSFRADCNKSPDSSETGPENDDVCLISPSSSQKARRPKSTGLGLRPSTKRHFIPKPYEIKDDPVDVVKPCSATDKNPKEFHAKNSKFVIPKTKKETRSDNSLSASCITSEKRHMTRQQRTNTRKFYGLPLVNGVSKPTRNSNDAETRSITLNRPWNHASPKRSGATRASSSALSRLKHDYTDTTNDTSVDNENQYTRSCHGESSAGEHLCLQTEAKDTRVQEHQCILHTVDIEDYQDGKDHIRELPLARNSSSENKPSLVTQADLFCPLCNGQMTQHGCLTCPKTNKSIKADDSAEEAQCKAASFISANNGPPKKILTYSSDKPVRKKKNRSNKAKTSSLIDQTRIDKSEKLEFSEMDGKKGRKRKSSPEPKHPELVHISSDEENNEEMNAITNNQSPEQPEDDIFETTNHSEHGKDTDDIVQQHESGKESEEQKITAKTTPTEHEDESRSRKKKKRRKQEKSRQTAENHFDMYQRDFLNSSIVVDTVFVGKLKGQATSPVEVTPDRIIISMTSENDVEYVFKLEGRDLTSFVISNESTPLVIILVPTSAWARKIREKYWPIKKDVFIDPGSAAQDERQILLFLHKQLQTHELADLIELVDERLCDYPVMNRISSKEARDQVKLIISSGHSQSKTSSSSSTRCSTITSNSETDSRTPASKSSLSWKRSKSRSRSSSESSCASNSAVQDCESPMLYEQLPLKDDTEATRGNPETTREVTETSKEDTETTKAVLELSPELTCTNPPTRKRYHMRSKTLPVANNLSSQLENFLDYPPGVKHGVVSIRTFDLECLEPDKYINDVIIDFFLKYLMEEELSLEDKNRTHIFSAFFYKRLTQRKQSASMSRTPEYMHSLVRTWTKNVDIFSKDFLIIPIIEHAHWFLAIICYPGLVAKENEESDKERECLSSPSILKEVDSQSSEVDGETPERSETMDSSDQEFDNFVSKINNTKTKRTTKRKSVEKPPQKARPCLLLFDSLGLCHRTTVLNNLRSYLTCEWKERKKNEKPLKFDAQVLKGCYPKVPCQENSTDCGVYVLQYVESFFKKPIVDYNFPIVLTDWFSLEVVHQKREYLKDLIVKLKNRADALDTN